MGVELIGDEDPFGVGILPQRFLDSLSEVDLGAGCADAGMENASVRNFKNGNDRQGAVPSILKLKQRGFAGQHWFFRMDALKGLDAGFLVNADDVLAYGQQTRSRVVQLADTPHAAFEGGLIFDLRILPVFDPVGAQINLVEHSTDGSLRDAGCDTFAFGGDCQFPVRPNLDWQPELGGFSHGKRNDPALLLRRIKRLPAGTRRVLNGGKQ